MKTDGWELSLSWRDSFKLGGKPFDYSIKAMVWDSKSVITKYVNDTGSLGTVKGFIENGGSPSSYYVGMTVGEIWGVHRGRSVPRSGGHRLFGHSRLRTGVGQGDAPRAGQDRRSGRQRLHRSGQFRRRRPRRPAIIGNQSPRYRYGVNLGPLERHRIVGLPARRRRAGLVSGFRCGHVLGKNTAGRSSRSYRASITTRTTCTAPSATTGIRPTGPHDDLPVERDE